MSFVVAELAMPACAASTSTAVVAADALANCRAVVTASSDLLAAWATAASERATGVALEAGAGTLAVCMLLTAASSTLAEAAVMVPDEGTK